MKRDPFTRLCQSAAKAAHRRADLHVHTTHSDGTFTPSQVVLLAKEACLAAVAVTDHDTLSGIAEAQAAAAALPGWSVPEVVPGVEITADFDGREVHLLGYFVDPADPALNAAMSKMCDRRRDRFRDYLARLADAGATIPKYLADHCEALSPSLGRRHVAELLVKARHATTRHEAFAKFLGPMREDVLPKHRLAAADAVTLVRAAGGFVSLAHPPGDFTDDHFRRLAELGLAALEANYPWGRNSPAGRLREAADRFGLAVTGGSDCHGPEPAHRRVGTCGITIDELNALRPEAARTAGADPAGPAV